MEAERVSTGRARATEALFDLSDEYEAMLHEGIRLSGENRTFFEEGRLRLLARHMRSRAPAARILDFGCGLGHTSKRLRELFPESHVTGADTSVKTLDAARERHGGPGLEFVPVERLTAAGAPFDLCYVNGVFHHIVPEERAGALALIRGVLRRDGVFALFENNPWNFGTRMVMARIPFDRDAQTLSPPEAASLLRGHGFHIAAIDSLFFFPRFLEALRVAEPWLSWTRLGAQYLVLGERR